MVLYSMSNKRQVDRHFQQLAEQVNNVIIKNDGLIVYRQFNLDYHIRATVKDILDNLPKK